jgi:hypothetical protein
MTTHPALRRLGWASVWIVIFAVALVFLVAGCGPVEDGGKKGASKFVGGRIQNSSKSVETIDVYFSWGSKGPAGKRSVLSPGEVTSGSKDADGFCLRNYPAELTTTTIGLFGPFTSKGTRGPGECVKVSDNESVLVKVVKRLKDSRS